MSIARATGEKWDSPPQQSASFADMKSIEKEFLRCIPHGRKYLIVYQMRVVTGWTWSEIAEGVKLSRGHCSRVFRATEARIESLRQEKFAGVARFRVVRESDDDE